MTDTLTSTIERTFGLRPRPDAHRRIERILESNPALGLAAPAAATQLWSCAEAYSVPESYFNRHAEQFEALLTWARGRQTSRSAPLRVWSAGCAGGEEAYSVALALCPSGGASELRTVQILGTDMSTVAVSRAREARYSHWALRGASPEFLSRYFDKERDGRFRLRLPWRGMATFERDSLLQRAARFAPGSLDVVLFRNVAVYLEPETIERFYEQVQRVLSPGGLLLTAAADQQPQVELFGAAHPRLTTVHTPLAAQRESLNAARTLPPLEVPAPQHSLSGTSRVSSVVPPVSYIRPKLESQPATEGSLLLLEAQRLIAGDQFDDAHTRLRRGLYLYQSDPQFRFWLAVTLRAQGDRDGAAREVRQLLLEHGGKPELTELLRAAVELAESVA
jgi:chemotaxis methyl-accepting protein methylase